MADCIVHFGMHKTGSSSIQHSLFRALSDPKFLYVNLGEANASEKLVTVFKKNPARYHGHVMKGRSAKQVQEIKNNAILKFKAELEVAGANTPIVSGEDICNFNEQEFRALSKFIAATGRNVVAVGYIRSPKSYMESAFQQRLRDKFVKLDVEELYPCYKKRFEKFISVLGEKKVHFWRFDPSAFTSGCVVQDFCNRIGIQSFQPNSVIRTNEALSLPAISLLYAYRKYGPVLEVGKKNLRRENALLIKRLSRLSGPKLRLHSCLVQPVLEQNRVDLAWMEEHLGSSLTEDLAAHDDMAVRSVEDLFAFKPETTQWLASQLGTTYESRWHERMAAEEVAHWMHLLKQKLVEEENNASPGQRQLAKKIIHR